MSVLADGLTVPPQDMTVAALETLEQLGMLTLDPERATEELTPLGRRVVNFPTPPHVSKALVYSSVFRLVLKSFTVIEYVLSEKWHNGVFPNIGYY